MASIAPIIRANMPFANPFVDCTTARVAKPKRLRTGLTGLMFVAFMLVTACSDATPEANPTSTNTAAPDTFKPQVTLLAPTAKPSPTALPATAIPTATTEPTPEAAASLAADANPFTGLKLDAEALKRRPILIKIANTSDIRPQSNLATADIVVEHYAEGGITRFTALYLANAPDRVGSVRSCRLIDIELPKIFDAALVCSGTSPGVKPLMRESWGFQNDLTMISDFGPYECPSCPMFRTSDRVPPHNLFANAGDVWKELDKRENNQPTTFKSWAFSNAAPSTGTNAKSFDLGYRSGVVGWRYDSATKLWSRTLSGQSFDDAETGKQITAANILVVNAFHATTLIQEDTTGSRSIQIQLWGEGPLKVFRDGKMIEGVWRRPGDVGILELRDSNGQPIALKPGNTWIQLVPGDLEVTVEN